MLIVATLALTAVLAQPAPVEDPQPMWAGHHDTGVGIPGMYSPPFWPATGRVYTSPPRWPSPCGSIQPLVCPEAAATPSVDFIIAGELVARLDSRFFEALRAVIENRESDADLARLGCFAAAEGLIWTAMDLELPGCKQSCTDDSDCSSSPPCFGLCDNLGPGWSGTCT